MSTSELKYTLFRAIDTINDNKILKDIYSFVSQKTKTDFWETLSKEQKEEIEKALKELDSGAAIPHEKVMAKYKGKYI